MSIIDILEDRIKEIDGIGKEAPFPIPEAIKSLESDDLLDHFVFSLIENYCRDGHYMLASYLINKLAKELEDRKNKMNRWAKVAEKERIAIEFRCR